MKNEVKKVDSDRTRSVLNTVDNMLCSAGKLGDRILKEEKEITDLLVSHPYCTAKRAKELMSKYRDDRLSISRILKKARDLVVKESLEIFYDMT